MGANKTYMEHPAMGQNEVFERYQSALKTLTCRALGEPYNFRFIDEVLTAEMCGGDYFGKVLAECQKQYRESGRYSPQSVSLSTGFNAPDLLKWAQADAEMDLPASWDAFSHHYGQWVEIQIADCVRSWIGNGSTSEEIRVTADSVRKEKGLTARVKNDDGKVEFEKELLAAIDCKRTVYPARPPLKVLREAAPFFEPGDYVVVAGRTGMGKSYFGLNSNYQCAVDGVASCYINAENTARKVQRRIWQMHSGVQWQPEYPGVSQQQIRHMMESWEWAKNCKINCVTPARTLRALTSAIQREYYEHGCQLAVVDYIQKFREPSFRGQRVDELAEISAELRQLAAELKISIMALAQINREAEKSADKRPNLADIRGSGDIEQDATMVMLLYRPEYYNIEIDADGNLYPEHYADIRIAKGRDIETGLIKCRFNNVKGFYDNDPFAVSDSASFAPAATQFPATARPSQNDEDIPF